jgi:asparagine synthetase B (glutamine-hydrolysing)
VLEEMAARLGVDDGAAGPDLPPLAHIVAAELRAEHSRLASALLRFEDRMGMAGHVEVRVPFLDHRLVELCAGFGDADRARLFSGKELLRQAVADWLPEAIVRRPKVGFNRSAPAVSALVLAQPEDAPLRALMSREAVESRGYFTWARCEALLRARNFPALDHVFVLHLLDELFVRDFDPRRAGFPRPAAAAASA